MPRLFGLSFASSLIKPIVVAALVLTSPLANGQAVDQAAPSGPASATAASTSVAPASSAPASVAPISTETGPSANAFQTAATSVTAPTTSAAPNYVFCIEPCPLYVSPFDAAIGTSMSAIPAHTAVKVANIQTDQQPGGTDQQVAIQVQNDTGASLGWLRTTPQHDNLIYCAKPNCVDDARATADAQFAHAEDVVNRLRAQEHQSTPTCANCGITLAGGGPGSSNAVPLPPPPAPPLASAPANDQAADVPATPPTPSPSTSLPTDVCVPVAGQNGCRILQGESCSPPRDYLQPQLLSTTSEPANSYIHNPIYDSPMNRCILQAQRSTGGRSLVCGPNGGLPRATRYNACNSTEELALTVHSFDDVSSCFNIDQKTLFGIFNVESGFRVNLESTTGAAGFGQLTGPAILDVNQMLAQRSGPVGRYVHDMLFSDQRDSCRRLSQAVAARIPPSFSNRCDAVFPPDRAVENMIYTAAEFQINKARIAEDLGRSGVRFTSDDNQTKFENLAGALANNAGSGSMSFLIRLFASRFGRGPFGPAASGAFLEMVRNQRAWYSPYIDQMRNKNRAVEAATARATNNDPVLRSVGPNPWQQLKNAAGESGDACAGL